LSYLGRRDYDEERLGYSLRYEDGEAFKIDIYVYDNNDPNIGEKGVTESVKNEFPSIGNAIKYHEDKGNYLDVKLIEEGVIELGHKKIEFLWSQHQYKHSESSGATYLGERISNSYLTARNNNFFKIRLTLTEIEFEKRKNEIDRFLLELSNELGSF
jgi:hypothetical protein